MRKEEIFFDAITNLREDLVEAAQNYAFRRRVRWERWAGLAACLALVAFLSLPLLLPSGGSGGAPNSAADQTAPMTPEAVPPAEAPAGDSGDGGDGGEVSGEPAPGASEGAALLRIEATVLEVRENTLLVELDPDAGIAVQAVVPLEGVAGLPALREGDRITISCAAVQETEPAQLTGVTEITLSE